MEEDLYLQHFATCSFSAGERDFRNLLEHTFPTSPGIGVEYWNETRLTQLNYWARFRILLGQCYSSESTPGASTLHEMEALYRSAHEHLVDHSVAYANCLDQLGNLCFYQGFNRSGIEIGKVARASKQQLIDRGIAEPNEVRIDRTLIILGKNYWKDGDLYNALTSYVEALEVILTQQLESRHSLGRIACLLAQTFLELNDYKFAQSLVQFSLDLFDRNELSSNHIYRAVSHNILGRALSEMPRAIDGAAALQALERQYDKAAIHFAECQRLLDDVLPPVAGQEYPHRYRASLLGNRAILQKHRAQLIRCRQLLEGGYDPLAAELGVGPTEPKAAGKLRLEAIDLLRRNIRMRKQTFQKGVHSTIANAYVDLGNLFESARQYEAAALSAQAAIHALYDDPREGFHDLDAQITKASKGISDAKQFAWLSTVTSDLTSDKPASFTRLIMAVELKARTLHRCTPVAGQFDPLKIAFDELIFLVEAYQKERLRRQEQKRYTLRQAQLDKFMRPVYQTAIPLFYDYFLRENEAGRGSRKLDNQIFDMWQKAKRLKMLNAILARRQGKAPESEFPDLIKPMDEEDFKAKVRDSFKQLSSSTSRDLLQLIRNSFQQEERGVDSLADKAIFFQRVNGHLPSNRNGQQAVLSVPPKDFTIEELLAQFQGGDPGCIISYFVIDLRIYVLMVYSAAEVNFRFVRLRTSKPEVARTKHQISRLYEAFNDSFWDNKFPDGEDMYLHSTGKTRLNELNHTIENSTRELYFSLFRELDQEYLAPYGVQRIYLVPYDQLYLVPFECLGDRFRPPNREKIIPGTWQELDYLADRYYFSYHPSISVLYNVHKSTDVSPQHRSVPVSKYRLLQLVVDGKHIDNDFQVWLDPKNFNSTIEELNHLFNGGDAESVVLPTGKKRVLPLRRIRELVDAGERFDVVHIGMHTQPESIDRNGEAQALIVGDQFRSDKRSHTLWKRRQIEQFQWGKRGVEPTLLLLNTCRGGVGEINEERAMDSLQSAFIQIGIKNVYYTLCRMNIYNSQQLLREFLTPLTLPSPRYTDNFGKSMQLAKRAMLQNPYSCHPRKWAPAVLSCDHLKTI